jgi:hypothetical protein
LHRGGISVLCSPGGCTLCGTLRMCTGNTPQSAPDPRLGLILVAAPAKLRFLF